MKRLASIGLMIAVLGTALAAPVPYKINGDLTEA